MLLHRNLERIIGTALIDHSFRRTLLASPALAAEGFDLSEEELGVLSGAQARTLEELASHVYSWITDAPKPRRVPAYRWASDGYRAIRAAV